MAKMTPGRLAKELDLSKIEMFNTMQELRINAKRMDAFLSVPQEEKLRAYFRNRATSRQKRMSNAARPWSPPPTSPNRPALRGFSKVCKCCDRRWIHKAEEDSPRPLCDHCLGHYQKADEPIERKLERAEAHARLFRVERDRAWEHAGESSREKDVAYQSRSKWRAALAEVVLDHDEGPDGLCWCGEKIPCRTWRKLDEANKGIHRQVEKWASWDDKRLEEFLRGERGHDYVIDEDEPADDSGDVNQQGA
ncbi:MAG TPA: hypothetical protein VIL87_02150 [Dermatophilaceae bacterium]|jgi:hypothetical protein